MMLHYFEGDAERFDAFMHELANVCRKHGVDLTPSSNDFYYDDVAVLEVNARKDYDDPN